MIEPKQLLSCLGNFWAEIYEGKQLLLDRADALLYIWSYANKELNEYIDAISRIDVPIYHTPEIACLELLTSSRTVNGSEYVYPLPDSLIDVQIITNRIENPSSILIKDIDYRLTDTNIIFFSDPTTFDTRKEYVVEDGNITDSIVYLWMCYPKYDWNYLANNFGYFLNNILKSTSSHKNMMNAMLDCIIKGTNHNDFLRFLSAALNIPVCLNDNEVVESIIYDTEETLIITDLNVYRTSPELSASVAIGDILSEGQVLINEFVLSDRLTADTPFICVTQDLLSGTYSAPLGFVNNEVDISLTGAPGNERIEWPLKATKDDETAFWDEVFSRQSQYYTLKSVMEPVPSKINPAKFLANNIFRNNGLYLQIHNQLLLDNDVSTFEWMTGLKNIFLPDKVLILNILQSALYPDLTEWLHYKTITIDHTNVPEDLTDFVLLVDIVDDADIGSSSDFTGYDIRFALPDGTVLPYECVRWENNNRSATGTFWVRVPFISSTVDTQIRCYYGCPQAINGSRPDKAWYDYTLVTHYDNDILDLTDYTMNGRDGTVASGAPTVGIGIKYNCLELSDTDSVSHQIPHIGTEFSILVWQKKDMANHTRLYSSLYGMSSILVSSFNISTDTGTKTVTSTSAVNDGSFHSIAATFSSSSLKIFVDGVLEDEEVDPGNMTQAVSLDLFMGNSNAPGLSDIDEVRIINKKLTDAWIAFHHYNVVSGGYSIGSEV